MAIIDIQSLEDLALGAAILGTGGGGDPVLGRLMAEEAIKKYGNVTLISPDDLEDEQYVATTGMIGAPAVVIEKIPNGSEGRLALRELEKYTGRKATAIFPTEIGGINSLVPVVLAAETGLPLVDADAIGRAFPEVQMTTFVLADINAGPSAVVDEKGNVIIINAIDKNWEEKIARLSLNNFGGLATVCGHLVTGKELKQAGIHFSLSLAMKIGKAVKNLKRQSKAPIDALVASIGAKLLFTGKVENLIRKNTGGFTRGEVRLDGLADYSGRRFLINFQNEFLISREDDRVIVTTPDLLSILDLETGTPITTEALHYGNRVAVIGIPCDRRWRSPKGIALAGPRYFGYDIEYKPLILDEGLEGPQ